jgi:hypothetical protein
MVQQAIAFAEIKRSFDQIRNEISDIRQLLASRRRDAEYSEFKCKLAALHFEKTLNRYVHAYRKAGFNPGQPRVPAGNREGGRWTGDGSGADSSADASNVLGSPVLSDATPDPVVPGTQYAQTHIEIKPSALTGISTIDEKTKQLATILATVVDSLPAGSGRLYGIAVHTAFASAVRAQQIPGIGFFDVETSFSLTDSFRYGSKDSVRTDVVLRSEVGDIVAIYDVKTGEATIKQPRAAELREKTKVGPEVPIIELNVRRGVMLKASHPTTYFGTHDSYLRNCQRVIHVYGN